MADLDDALLDEELVSLPDINDESNFESDSNNESTTDKSFLEEKNIPCAKHQWDDVLELGTSEEFEEYDESEYTKSQNVELKEAKYEHQYYKDKQDLLFHQEELAPKQTFLKKEDIKIECGRDNNRIVTLTAQKKATFESNLDTYQQWEGKDYSRLYESNTVQPPANFIWSSKSIQNPEMNFRSNIETFNISRPFQNDPYFNCQFDQSFLYNQNTPMNYPGNHALIQESLYPIHGNLPMHPIPYVNSQFQTSPMFPIPYMPPLGQHTLPGHSFQEIQNQYFGSNSHEPISFDYSVSKAFNFAPEYVLNPLYNARNLPNEPKILVNRNCKKSEVDESGYHDFRQISRNNYSEQFLCKSLDSHRHRSCNDPYSYFSDVWQEKKEISPSITLASTAAHENRKLNRKRPFKTYYKEHRSDSFNNQTNNMKVSNYKSDKIKSHKVNRHEILKDYRTKTREKKFRKRSIDKNNNTRIKDHTKSQESRRTVQQPSPYPAKEVIMDSEMIDYYKKMEEQHCLRETIVREKENRRKLSVFERLGIKEEPTFNLTGQKVHDFQLDLVFTKNSKSNISSQKSINTKTTSFEENIKIKVEIQEDVKKIEFGSSEISNYIKSESSGVHIKFEPEEFYRQ